MKPPRSIFSSNNQTLTHCTNQSGAAVYPDQAEFMTEQSRRSVMIDRLIYQREQEVRYMGLLGVEVRDM